MKHRHIMSTKALAVAIFITGFGGGYSAMAESLLEEIVVTAQKREEKLVDVPIAVSVLSSEQIEASFADNIESLQTLVPSASFRKGSTTRNSAITVRGIGTISFSIAAEPSVSTVVDGVVLGRSGQAFSDLYDLERIEVLRGPQGTLFGKNASAGVVNITTKRPSDEFQATLETSFFEDHEYRQKARVSGHVGKNARGSVTVFNARFDGYIDNVFDNTQVNGYDRQGVRGMLEIDASDSLNLLLIGEYYQADDDCCVDLEGLPSGRHPGSEALPDSAGIVNGEADIDLDQRRVDHDFRSSTEDETTAFSVQVDKLFDNNFKLTSITAWRSWDNTEIREGDFTSTTGDAAVPVDFGATSFQLHDVGPQEWEQFSQEIRIASPQGEDLEYQLGLYYLNIQSDRNFTRFASCQNNGGQNQAILDANPDATCNANDIVDATAFMSTEFDNYAAFGQGTYSVLDDWRLIAGFRYTRDDVEYNHNRRNNDELGRQGVGVRPRSSDTNFSGDTDNIDFSIKAGVQWDFHEASTVYATYSEGYKGPAFNVFYNMGPNDTLPIDEETSESYEVGIKYATNSLIVSAAAFRTDIDDFQANNFDNSTGVTITRLTNAGSVITEGTELDFIWRPLENFTLYGGFAFVSAEIDEFNCPAGAACTGRSGLDVPFAPDEKYSLSGEYLIPVTAYDMDIILNASYIYTDEQRSTLPNNDGTYNPAALLPDYGIFNASVGLSFEDDKYRLTFVGKNLSDETYATTFSGDNFRYQIPRDAERYFGINLRVGLN